MKIIIGLGNPGEKYKNTRHNVGFKILDELQKKLNFEKFLMDKKTNAEISTGIIDDKKIILAKPQTFMNDSGKSVSKLLNYYTPNTEHSALFIIHDDSDLKIGRIKISSSRGSGGHKGIESIIKEIKNNNFVRFRIGIRPKKEIGKAEKFVLKKFGLMEKLLIKKTIEKTVEAIILSITESQEKVMNKFN